MERLGICCSPNRSGLAMILKWDKLSFVRFGKDPYATKARTTQIEMVVYPLMFKSLKLFCFCVIFVSV